MTKHADSFLSHYIRPKVPPENSSQVLLVFPIPSKIDSVHHCRSCTLSMIVEDVFLSIHRSSIIIQDSIITFCLYLYPSMCVWCISALLFQSGSPELFFSFHITLPSSTSSLYSYIISCGYSSILVHFDFLVL